MYYFGAGIILLKKMIILFVFRIIHVTGKMIAE